MTELNWEEHLLLSVLMKTALRRRRFVIQRKSSKYLKLIEKVFDPLFSLARDTEVCQNYVVL